MAVKYFVDAAGAYLGGFDGVAPPAGAVEVPAPPERAWDRWNGAAWVAGEAPAAVIADELAATDAGMARVVEDVISALVAKGMIALADLPQAARDKIAARQALRVKLGGAS